YPKAIVLPPHHRTLSPRPCSWAPCARRMPPKAKTKPKKRKPPRPARQQHRPGPPHGDFDGAGLPPPPFHRRRQQQQRGMQMDDGWHPSGAIMVGPLTPSMPDHHRPGEQPMWDGPPGDDFGLPHHGMMMGGDVRRGGHFSRDFDDAEPPPGFIPFDLRAMDGGDGEPGYGEPDYSEQGYGEQGYGEPGAGDFHDDDDPHAFHQQQHHPNYRPPPSGGTAAFHDGDSTGTLRLNTPEFLTVPAGPDGRFTKKQRKLQRRHMKQLQLQQRQLQRHQHQHHTQEMDHHHQKQQQHFQQPPWDHPQQQQQQHHHHHHHHHNEHDQQEPFIPSIHGTRGQRRENFGPAAAPATTGFITGRRVNDDGGGAGFLGDDAFGPLSS
ncbi:unnamed protein product, partial [Ectocarpus sp. 13 AM-2016]